MMKVCVGLVALFSLPCLASVCDADLLSDPLHPATQDIAVYPPCDNFDEHWRQGSEQALVFDVESDTRSPQSGDYWKGWLVNDKNDSNPIVTQQLDHSYLGLGLWVPSALVERERDMDTEEWLINHGLKFSLGFGERESGEPRVRFDYRWHEEYQADWFMQIEVPF